MPVYVKLCRSKKFTQILNKMDFCLSYKEFEKIGIRLTERVIEAPQSQLATVPQVDLGLLPHPRWSSLR